MSVFDIGGEKVGCSDGPDGSVEKFLSLNHQDVPNESKETWMEQAQHVLQEIEIVLHR